MTIGIEAERANNPQKTGVEHYAKQLILHLAKIDFRNQYILYLRSQPEAWFFKLPKNFKVKVMPFPIFWTQLRISLEMLLHPVDVLFIPASALPFVHPKKSVVTVHDVAWRYFPESFTRFMRWFLNWSTGFAAKSASRIIAVSKSTKKDLIRFYGVDSGKISVIHHGFESLEPEGRRTTELKKGLPKNYALFLSTLQPRKNLEGLIDAFAALKKEYPEILHKLVVVGRMGWKFESILQKINHNREFVEYLNYVADRDRFAILSGADLLVVPSFYEGFGMQILEAFNMNVPVAASKTSSMPEVAGEAAVYFDPKNIMEMKNAVKSVLLDKSFSDSLRQKGKERLKDFSWDKCARETLKILSAE